MTEQYLKKSCIRCNQGLHSSASRSVGYCANCEGIARSEEKLRRIKEAEEQRQRTKTKEFIRNIGAIK